MFLLLPNARLSLLVGEPRPQNLSGVHGVHVATVAPLEHEGLAELFVLNIDGWLEMHRRTKR
jgi:hypothetical protein